MSLTGIHVECGVATVRGSYTIFDTIWSETVPYGFATTQTVPVGLTYTGNLVFRIRNSAAGEAYVARGTPTFVDPTKSSGVAANWAAAVGAAPNGSSRAHFLASELRDLPALPGEAVKAIAA